MGMTEQVLQRIRQEKLACMLLALKGWAVGKGHWVEDVHGDEFRRKFEILSQRWK